MEEKSPLKATLTAKGLGNVLRTGAGTGPEFDFVFVVDDRRHHCPWFVAEFLSPKLCSERSADRTMNKMRLNTTDPENLFC
jgi:hypothetical protein